MLHTFVSPRRSSTRPALAARIALVLGLAAASSACVTQARYDEAIQELQFYQRSYQDQDSYAAQLQAQLAEKEAEIRALQEGGLVPVEAGYSGDIDERMQELRDIMARLGSRPNEVEVIDVEGGYGLRMQDAILFESGSAELRPEGRALVLQVAERIGAAPFRKLEVRGHTDSVPVRKPETLQRFPNGNLELSTARAIQVASLLKGEGGVEGSKVVVSGYGPNEPIAGNDTEEGRRRNRRVELYVLD